MKFLDEVKIYACAGDGGAGCVSFRRERFIARGGPDGGDGGNGGDIIAECVDGLNTLIDYRYQQHLKAAHGKKGRGRNRSGAKGENKILALPLGTQVFDESGKVMLGELLHIGQSVPIFFGGHGGHGNASFRGPSHQSPRYAQSGEKGQEGWLKLQLNLIAHAGLVGLPNAGKSSLLSVLSAARPKIADYPFTTLHPHLGLMRIDHKSFVLADIPGLIEGAHQGAGLGHGFLRHIERCQVLVHLIDCTLQNSAQSWTLIRKELETYSAKLAKKPELIMLSKSDLISDKAMSTKIKLLEAHTNKPVLALSSLAHRGLSEAKRAIAIRIKRKPEAEFRSWHP